MEIKQRRNSNRIRYVFGEDELQYQWEDGSGSRSFSVPYTDISRDRQTLVERNAWLRNVGLLWLAIGAGTTAINWFSAGELKASIWLLIGAGCYGAYRLRSTSFTIVPSEKGSLLVIDGEEGRRILAEIESRRAAQFRREYDFMPEGDTAEQLRGRFKWLHKEGALSDEELQRRLAVVDASDAARQPAEAAIPRAVLN
ncbi:hypothetical protein [Cognatilysobacter bugurensis]|uniref:Uncharacterized protein n=1 Tax=Cognatilysobacter bugurensis TaxID=543356 RepID=A0A918SWB4_9GAMM|nr:hypothetical protein [Lysobacter bugurensis]GHA72080.1 hypothetical protein GCM10007067_05680 [Lysobacter bugurensis]